MVRRSTEQQSHLETALRDLFAQQCPFNRWLGVEMAATGPSGPSVTLTMRLDFVGNAHHERLHGGVIASVLDIAGGFTLMLAITEKYADEPVEQVLRRFERMGTIDMRVDYLRPGIGQHFVATADVTRLGGRVGATQMQLVGDDEVLIATGAACYIVS
jgi:uncharacterized protein (TIGR00369 family)